MLTYIYVNVEDYLLTYYMPPKRFKLQILINYFVIPENVISDD